MRVIRHGNTTPVRMDSATSTDATTRAVFAREARKAMAIVDALDAAAAKGGAARVEQLVHESRRDRGAARLDVAAARASYLKACEDRWKDPPAGGATRNGRGA